MKTCATDHMAARNCVSCRGGVAGVKGASLARLVRSLVHRWKAVDGHHLEKEFTFKNFKEALRFTNQVGELAEEQGHPPDIFLAWGRVKVSLWTHKVDGLTENDFVLAAKIEALSGSRW
jgi:4a-hydroxytetrahydrobiopterin dehydratase